MIVELLLVGIVGSMGAIVGRVLPRANESPAEKRCSATMVSGPVAFGVQGKVRCAGAADPRCAGNQCTAHCREHCHGKCLE